MTRPLTTTLLLLAALFFLTLSRYSPPPPLPLPAPPTSFSASRAREIQKAISGDARPRDIASESNVRARAFLEHELAKSGFRTEIQTAMACSRHGVCSRVANVVATRAGKEPDAASVLLMAHYDSVTCSPGASDDGMGTSTVVETARAIAAGAPLRRTVVVVLTDGEESGLLGATAFANEHPLAKNVHGAINVDARGSVGPSAMFETSAGNAWIVGLFARRAERPVTSSLFYEIYKRMPNDTDFTAVKDRVHGMNFANIAGVENYHTPHDSLDNADVGTLQHHGDQALAMVRALADAGPELDARQDRTRDAVWFDVMASFVVRWPAAASVGLALLALALVVLSAIRLRAWGLGLAASLSALVAALIASVMVGSVLKYAGAVPVPWVAYPLPSLLALHVACISAGVAAARLIGRRSSPEILWAGTWLTWAVLGVVTAVVAPGACFLFVVPAFAAGFVSLLRIEVAAALPALVAAVLWLPIAILAYDGLGLAVPPLACLSATMLVSTLPALFVTNEADAPRSPKRAYGLIGFVVAFTIAAVLVPKFSVATPQRVNVVFRQDEPLDGTTPPAHVYVDAAWAYMPWGKPPEAMTRALGDPARVHVGASAPWSTPMPFGEVPRIVVAKPTVFVLASGPSPRGWNVRARLQSPRGARTIALVLPASRATTVTVEGHVGIPHNDALVLRGVAKDGIEVTIEADGQKAIALTILDVTPGLPSREVAPIARDVLDARDARAVQSQEGDLTIVANHVEL